MILRELLNIHALHHAVFLVYVLLLLLILYRPPRLILENLGHLHTFFEAHYGDTIGFCLLLLAVALIIVGDVWPALTHTAQAGESLLLAAMGVLKLSKPMGANGNGNSAPPPVNPKPEAQPSAPAQPAQ